MVLNHSINWKTFLFDLSNRIAIVTGASQGIGNTIAKVLAHSGAHVICIARTEEKLKDITEAASGQKINLIPLIISAAKNNATLGEIVDSMKKVYGEWSESVTL